MTRPLAALCAMLALFLAVPAHADVALDEFARDLDRAESLRAVKRLQHSYAQYAQYGLWNEVGGLFTREGRFVFDGLVKKPAGTATGGAAIAAFLRDRYGAGVEGHRAGSLSAMMIDAPVVNLSTDGNSATARWQTIIFHGYGGKARIEGGVFVNEYVRERGVWKIATAHYNPQYDGPYEEGWTNWGGGDLPVVPYHFDAAKAGIPVPPAEGRAPVTKATLAALQARVDTLNDEDRIRNLQAAYGYYADRRMWDDVVDLFAADGVVEVGGQGIWKGKAGVRRWLDGLGKAGLSHGQLNDRLQNDVIITISPGGNEAFARGIELGMLGEADREQGWWEVATFRNRFVKEDGVWKIREMRRFVQMKTDIFLGWGKSRIVEPAPGGANAPDAGVPRADMTPAGLAMPAFLGVHPVTGRAVKAAGSLKLVAAQDLTGRVNSGRPAGIDLAEARRRLARSTAYDGVENISAAYGFFVDDMNTLGWASTMAKNGFKETPFQGYHIGRDRLIAARVRGEAPTTQQGISYHWLMQPVVLVSEDGRSATGRFRLFQPRTGKTVGKAGDFFSASFWGGMYHDRYVLEDGAWRIWELTLDEPYITPVAWKDGVWAKAKDPAPRPAGAAQRAPANNANVDVPVTALGRREEHFQGGTGVATPWPAILPMWFTYTNPVTGRVPENHQPDCVLCALRPELKLDRNGYQEPPDAPAANRSP
ncbi:MAG TPA: nuclear transport factor 2 family protein [Steroidobacteraceae bacterium]|nr:nuclear transport factor 2 family protein [Steroidobacteraceae bacterium]